MVNSSVTMAVTPLNDNFVGLEMQVGHIQIILSDVSLKIRNTYIKLDRSVTRPG